ncbi:hypothetical protein EDD37DRAFT_328510 [Exophiala viscosa]|uniref:uncharacterized protein n=1 Tax=Exophiala viscosa TaxID=2486360 RepID=UPI0021A00FCB|nr:hypothetical protein EDD37DRAFT_328510 [Exophiala viscosa]
MTLKNNIQNKALRKVAHPVDEDGVSVLSTKFLILAMNTPFKVVSCFHPAHQRIDKLCHDGQLRWGWWRRNVVVAWRWWLELGWRRRSSGIWRWWWRTAVLLQERADTRRSRRWWRRSTVGGLRIVARITTVAVTLSTRWGLLLPWSSLLTWGRSILCLSVTSTTLLPWRKRRSSISVSSVLLPWGSRTSRLSCPGTCIVAAASPV